MKFKLIFILTITLLILQSCCQLGSGKSCDERDSFGQRPVINISFKGYPGTNFKVITYVQENNLSVDSIIQTTPSEGICQIFAYKKGRGGDINEVRAKKYIIKHNNKSDTISQLNCTYAERTEKCLCDQITKGEYSNFTFVFKNQVLSVNSLTIDY